MPNGHSLLNRRQGPPRRHDMRKAFADRNITRSIVYRHHADNEQPGNGSTLARQCDVNQLNGARLIAIAQGMERVPDPGDHLVVARHARLVW